MKSVMESQDGNIEAKDVIRVEKGRVYIITSKGIWWTKIGYVRMLLDGSTIEVPLQRLAVSVKTLKIKKIRLKTAFNKTLPCGKTSEEKMTEKKTKPHIWVSGDKFLVVTPECVWLAKTEDVQKLLEGKTDKVHVEKIRKDTVISLKAKTRIYSFVYPQKRLTEEQIKTLENMGFIPVQRELGETTRLVGVRIDTRNMNNLRIIQARLKQQGKKLTLTEVHRLALMKGIEQLMKETQPS